MTEEATLRLSAKDIGWQALGPAIACAALSTFIVSLRWYTRCRIVRSLGWDDYIILLSLVSQHHPSHLRRHARMAYKQRQILVWCSTGLIGAAVHHGVGQYDNGIMQTSIIAKLIVVNNDIWALTVNVTKASILMQYLRIFNSRRTRPLTYLLLFSLLPAVCWAVFGGTFLCTPVRKLWDPEVPGHCISAQKYWLSVAGVDIILDFLILLLPMPAISSLRLPRKQKVSLILPFALGFIICAVSLARLATVYITALEQDFVGSCIWAIIWSTVEANVGTICACLLALKPLVAKLFPRLVDQTKLFNHCMTLPTVQGIETGDDDDAATLEEPATPSTIKSMSDSMLKRMSSIRTLSCGEMPTRPATVPAEIGTLHLQRPLPARQYGNLHEVLGFADALRSDNIV